MKITFTTHDDKLRGGVLADGLLCGFSWCWRGIRIDVQQYNRTFGSYANRGTAAKAIKRALEQEERQRKNAAIARRQIAAAPSE